MLKMVYTRKSDRFQEVTLLGDAEGIRDLFWQLTHNYRPCDGTAIGEIKVYDLCGVDCTTEVQTNPHAISTPLSRLG